jgi:hypothetical protein
MEEQASRQTIDDSDERRSDMNPSRGLTLLARLGFAARGLVYILIGWFAIEAARSGSRPSDNQAALASLVDEPLGRVLLGVIAAGLAGYAVWRLLEALFDPEQRGRTAKGAMNRAGYALSGITHVGLAIYAARLAFRERVRGGAAPGDSNAQDWSAWLMEQPGGTMLVVLAGVILFVVAVTQVVKAYKPTFTRHLEGDVPAPAYVRTMGRIGYTARAIVFALVGWFFVKAALLSNPNEAGGIGQALRELQAQDYGPVQLGIIALGLLLFGVFSLIEARFRYLKVEAPSN